MMRATWLINRIIFPEIVFNASVLDGNNKRPGRAVSRFLLFVYESKKCGHEKYVGVK